MRVALPAGDESDELLQVWLACTRHLLGFSVTSTAWARTAPLIPVWFNSGVGAALELLASSMCLKKLHGDHSCKTVKLLLLAMATAYTPYILLHAVIELYFDA